MSQVNKKSMIQTWIAKRAKLWIKVTRVQTALVTALALWIGYVSVSQVDLETFIKLTIVGVLVHIWGFTLNEVKDKEYDKENSEEGQHPLAQGLIDEEDARLAARMCGGAAIVLSSFFFNSLVGNILLILSFGAGLAYNFYSKDHWWSNLYLSAWVALIALAGAAYAGQFSMYTWIVGLALAIQIFVQVIEGDMKDLLGTEKTFAGHVGVECEGEGEVVRYPNFFRRGITGLKLVELSLVSYMIYELFNQNSVMEYVVLAGFILFAGIFVATSTYYFMGRMDRDKIKKRSSIHELSSVLMIGMSTFWLHYNAAILIASLPVIWYVMFNKLTHSSALNPDI